jgi:hypothetical protein
LIQLLKSRSYFWYNQIYRVVFSFLQGEREAD